MASEILGLRTTIYKVDDLGKAKDWYARAFEAECSFDDAFYVGFTVGGFELGLMNDPMSAEKKTSNVLTYWGTADMTKALNGFVDLGATIVEEPHNVGGEIVVAAVSDPWGNVIGLIYNPDFSIG